MMSWYVRGPNDTWPGECLVSDDQTQYRYYSSGRGNTPSYDWSLFPPDRPLSMLVAQHKWQAKWPESIVLPDGI